MKKLALFQIIIIISFLRPFICDAKSSQKHNPIVIPLNDWASQRVLSKVVGKLYQQLGIPVSYQDIKVENQWGALKRGIVHIQIEVWQPSMSEVFNQYVKKLYILDLGTHEAKVREEWWYPLFVETLCPGLPHWQSLNACAGIFRVKGSKQKGVYHSGPWFYSDADLIRALKLDFVVEEHSDDKELTNKLLTAVASNKPIILLNWAPNWTDTRLKGKFIEFPEFSPECETNPQWGINKKLVKDCGNIKEGWLKKAAWPSLKKYNQCAYNLLKKISLNTKMISEAAALVVVDGLSEEQAADVWLEKFSVESKGWMLGVCSGNR